MCHFQCTQCLKAVLIANLFECFVCNEKALGCRSIIAFIDMVRDNFCMQTQNSVQVSPLNSRRVYIKLYLIFPCHRLHCLNARLIAMVFEYSRCFIEIDFGLGKLAGFDENPNNILIASQSARKLPLRALSIVSNKLLFPCFNMRISRPQAFISMLVTERFGCVFGVHKYSIY